MTPVSEHTLDLFEQRIIDTIMSIFHDPGGDPDELENIEDVERFAHEVRQMVESMLLEHDIEVTRPHASAQRGAVVEDVNLQQSFVQGFKDAIPDAKGIPVAAETGREQ